MIRYPYPVLSSNGSSYKEGIVFELNYINSVCISNAIIFEFKLELNSFGIRELIEKNKAKAMLKIQTGIYSTMSEISLDTPSLHYSLDLSKVMANDTLKFTAYVVSSELQELKKTSEMLDSYPDGYSINVKKNDILAISNVESLSYNTSDNSFIKFGVSNDMNGNGYSVTFKENYINVIIGPEFNKAYGIVKNNDKNSCIVFDSHIVFEVFVYALIELIQKYEDYSESEWYSLFEQVFFQSTGYSSFSDFIADSKDDDVIALDVVYKTAQLMINNQIENSIIVLSKNEEN